MFKKKSLILLFIFLYSCSHSLNNIIVVNSTKKDLGKSEYLILEKYLEKKLHNKFIYSSKSFLLEYYKSEYAPIILSKRAEIYMSRGSYQKASIDLERIYIGYPNCSIKDLAMYKDSICEYKLGNKLKAITLLEELDIDNLEDIKKEKSLWMSANLYKEELMYYKSALSLINLHSLTRDESIKTSVFISLNSIFSDLSLKDLDNLESTNDNKFLEPYILYEYGEALIKDNNKSKARSIFLEFISKFSDHEYYNQANSYLQKLENLEKVDPYTIGVILPLSGKYKAFGQRSLRGIQLAAGFFKIDESIFEAKDSNIRIAIVDSQSDPDIARLMVDKLISEDNVIGIIGPLRSSTATSVVKSCSLLGIPNISLSHKEDLQKESDYIFTVAMNKENQITKLIDYVYDVLGVRNFGILYPEDGFGKAYMKTFWDLVLKKGAQVTQVESYKTGQADFKEQFRNLSYLDNYEYRSKEFEEFKLLKEAEYGREPVGDELKLKPLYNYEVLFIPDDAKSVGQIAPYLAFYDIENVLIIGPNVLNSPNLIKRGKEHVEGSIFVDDFYINNKNAKILEFINNFRTVFGSDPGVLEAESYDATKIFISSINGVLKSKKKDEIKREDLRKEFLTIKDFGGVTGFSNFDSNGGSNKSLFILGVENGKIIQKK